MEKLNVLMVDDQPAKLLTYEAILAGLGETLIKAGTAREALSVLLKEEIAVVLMDVNMPELDGFELAAMIRQHPRCKKTAIIFVSAVHLTDWDRLRGYESGAVDYVSVPVVPEILRAKIGVFLDLYRKSAELERLNRSLEHRVAERTAELEGTVRQLRDNEIRLLQQGEALADADRRKNEFIAMLAHELRNPLQPIRMAMEMARQSQATEEQLRLGRDIVERQVNHLVRLIDDLMDASRITSGKLRLVQQRIDLRQVADAAADSIRELAQRKGQRLDVDAGVERLEIDADAARLTQVVVNLLSNGVKFTQPGGTIALSMARHGDSVIMRVRDNGVGIAAEDLDRIFEMFVQGSRNPGDTHEGLGLGLALVRRIVELHGGTVTATSQGRNRGSEFLVKLPGAGAAPADEAPLDGRAASAAPVPPADVARRILVVDDNRDAADTLSTMLRVLGHEVETQYSGAAAIAATTDRRPEIVVMDIGMPDIDGYAAARAIRGDGRCGETLLIAVTGWSGEVERQRSEAAGFDRHLVKPVAMTDLVAVLDSLRTP